MKNLILILIFISVNILAKDVSSYNSAEYKSSEDVKSKLEANSFEIVGEYNAMDDENFHVIVYTNNALKQAASAEGRGFAAVQKILIDSKDKTLVLTNPEYFLSAFLQDDYKESLAKDINTKLQNSFGEMEPSASMLEDDDISSFHFMFAMPYYEDMIELAEGDNLEATIEKNAGDALVFKLQLNNSTLYGISMNTENGEKSYINTIDATKRSAFLPYMILVEDSKAKILHAKYYLAISNPDLSMGQFTQIMSTPSDIEDYFTSLVK